MSKKTNAFSLRVIKEKNWVSRSFLEDFNYSKVLYQDLYIVNFIKNILQLRLGSNTIVKDIIVQRKTNKIHINISYYSLKKKKFFLSDSVLVEFWKRSRLWGIKKTVIRKKLKLLVNKKKRPIPFVVRMRLLEKDYLFIYSFKRLILLNLILLTRCRVQLYVVNLVTKIFFPIRPVTKNMRNKSDIVKFINSRSNIARLFDKKELFHKSLKEFTYQELRDLSPRNFETLKTFFGKILHSVQQIMKFFRIPWAVERIIGLDTQFLTHLICTSFCFKSPNLLGVYISRLVKKNIKSFYYLFNFLKRVIYGLYMISDLRGLKIQFKGRLSTRLRKKKTNNSFWFFAFTNF